jgi:cell division protein FtsI (penicillin-binding protein 3)
LEPERLKIARRRQSWLFMCLLAFGSWVGWSFFEIQVVRHDRYLAAAQRQQKKRVEIPPERGTIYDRNGVPLAVNREQYGLYVVPRHIRDVDAFVERLTALQPLDEADLRRRIARGGWYVRIARGVPRETVQRIEAARLDGIGVESYHVRHHPYGELATSVLGRVDVDNEGIEGIELQYDETLRGEPGYAVHQRDALGREFPNFTFPVEPPVDGDDVFLTIDVALQEIVESALDQAMERTQAKSGSVVVADPRTGEILALASRPILQEGSLRLQRNEAIVYQFEPGSTLKIVTLAGLYEEGLAAPGDSLFCENGVWNHDGRIVRDVHPYGTMSVEEVIEESSNICSVKLAERLGPERFYEYARRFGFGLPTGLDFPGEPRGMLKRPDDWSALTMASVAMGYEVMVTSLQMAMAYGAIANGGNLLRPYVVDRIVSPSGEIGYEGRPQTVRRVMEPRTAALVREALVRVVEGGTAQSAGIEMLPVAGKTGTARKTGEHGYVVGRYTSSFAGFFPAQDAKYVIFVRIDEPQGAFYGGTVAAPVFRETMRNALMSEVITESPAVVEGFRAPERVVWKVSDGFGELPPAVEAPGIQATREPEGGARSVPEPGHAAAPDGTGEMPTIVFDPRRHVKVPDFTGLSLREAVQAAASLNLRLFFDGTGRIVAQEPEPGEIVDRGASVRVRDRR